MVYIHEGGFFAGGIHTLVKGPQYFMDAQQVIMVLMTYRLGVMGKNTIAAAVERHYSMDANISFQVSWQPETMHHPVISD